ncbi:hypothetical protein [Maritimibacter sp. 55A14]|uniref:hypothetical protein n=1 Tax=Maritimibacter sp. 55A14 TaxID=2174844 RepID=UPI0011B1DCEF|nr:hypothetical protein [Maritimibacter sp. 55A14]
MATNEMETDAGKIWHPKPKLYSTQARIFVDSCMKKTHFALALSVFIVAVVFSAVMAVERIPFKSTEDLDQLESRVIAAARNAYTETRFDSVAVELKNGILETEVIDDDACRDGATVRSIKRVIDLSHHRLDPNINYGDSEGGETNFILTFSAVGAWKNKRHELREEAKTILRQAQAEVGRGAEAADLASERFLRKHPINTLYA